MKTLRKRMTASQFLNGLNDRDKKEGYLRHELFICTIYKDTVMENANNLIVNNLEYD